MARLGIDFGTSNSSASYYNSAKKTVETVVFNETGTTKLPSVVYLPSSGIPMVGQGPYLQLESIASLPAGKDRDMALSSTILSIKRKLSPNGFYVSQDGKRYSHVQIVAAILEKIREEAAKSCGVESFYFTELTLTHPVMFENWQLDMLNEASHLAGFQTVDFLQEPISAALGVLNTGYMHNCSGLIVYDFGGGTFDASYVRLETGKPSIPIPPVGDAHCGGDDLDYALYTDWENFVKQTMQRTISNNSVEADLGFLMQCRKEKESLTNIPTLFNQNELLPPLPGHSFERATRTLKREDVNNVFSPVIERTISLTRNLMDMVEANNFPLSHIVLIGGSSRIPLIKEQLQSLCGSTIQLVQPGIVDSAVAIGASYYMLPQTEAEVITPDLTPVFCTHCSHKLLKSWRFCNMCGKPNIMYEPDGN